MKRMCITTVVDENYYQFVPLFRYCIKKAYPEYDCIVFTRGFFADGDEKDPIYEIKPDTYNKSKYAAAALRFLIGDGILDEYEYCLITDVDIMIQRQSKDIIDQHVGHMNANALGCYDNSDHGDHMPGIHFVTSEWWPATRKVREELLERLKNQDTQQAQDEMMIREIVWKSKLPTSTNLVLWGDHGIHLGRFRNKNMNGIRYKPDEFEFMDSLVKDKEFMEIAKESCQQSENVANVWNNAMFLYMKRKP